MSNSSNPPKLSELDLLETNKSLQNLVANLPDPIYEIVQRDDGYTFFAYISDAARNIYEIKAEEILKDPSLLFNQIHFEDRESYYAALKNSAEVLVPFHHEWRIITPSEQLKWLYTESIPKRLESGATVWYGTFWDITSRKQIEAELQAEKQASESANLAKSNFIASMSHDLRSPMNAILGFTQLMESSSKLTDEDRESIQMIRSSGEHLLNLINKVLEVSKMQAGRVELVSEDFDLTKMLDEIQDLFQLKAANKNLQFLLYRDRSVPHHIHTDRLKLRQVLVNLLNNAIKSTTTGGVSVHVSAVNIPAVSDRPRMKIDFKVIDTGEGMEPEEISLLFESFSRSKSDKVFPKNSGLDLIISRQFVRLMGGDITVESQIHQGSVFKFNVLVDTINVYDFSDFTNKQNLIEATPSQTSYPASLSTEAIAALPSDLTMQLQQAIQNIDIETISQIIQKISKTDPSLASVLSHYIDNFEYERILSIITSTQEKTVQL